jgi:hypothetical protein
MAIRYRLDAFDQTIEVPTRTPRTPDGAPSIATVRYFGNFVGSHVVDRPPAYLVDHRVAEHLVRHGLAVEPAPASIDAEVATVTDIGREGGRKILESAEVGDMQVAWRRGTRSVPAGYQLVRTEQPLAAIAVYLCEPQSDDGAVENGLITAPAVGDEFPIWRAWP